MANGQFGFKFEFENLWDTLDSEQNVTKPYPMLTSAPADIV